MADDAVSAPTARPDFHGVPAWADALWCPWIDRPGDEAPRGVPEAHARLPLELDRKARPGARPRLVVVAPGGGVFNERDAVARRRDALWVIAEACQWVDLLVVAPDPSRAVALVPPAWRGAWPTNVWLAAFATDQDVADAVAPSLLAPPAPNVVLLASPMVGPMRLRDEWLRPGGARGLSWVVVGGQRGADAAPFRVSWAYAAAAQCARFGVPLFVERAGAFVVDRDDAGFDADTVEPAPPGAWPEPADVLRDIDGVREDYQGAPVRVVLRNPSGADPAEWPARLRVRQRPGDVAGGNGTP